ncbi:MAG: thioesterase family protein [Sulfuricaulis sp.]|nr:thioesterase family protein [Sulfuricaulis sp.]
MRVAYLTDYVLAHVPLLQVMPYPETGRMLAASVNHALWFYGHVKADDWFLVEVSCPVAASGRGLATAKIYDGQGRVVAVTSQECVYRP